MKIRYFRKSNCWLAVKFSIAKSLNGNFHNSFCFHCFDAKSPIRLFALLNTHLRVFCKVISNFFKNNKTHDESKMDFFSLHLPDLFCKVKRERLLTFILLLCWRRAKTRPSISRWMHLQQWTDSPVCVCVCFGMWKGLMLKLHNKKCLVDRFNH